MSEPTYTITVTVERTDEPGARFKGIFEEIPRASAEDPNYFAYSAVETFRRFCVNESRPDPREA